MSDEICINARTLDGRSREIKISKELTISDLKGKIEQATQMPKSRQRIIYQGRVLKDTLVLGQIDNGKLDGAAVHVVDSVPPQPVARQGPSSARDTQQTLLNGDNPTLRNRNRRTPASRESTVRSRVSRMEQLLSNLNSSITAMERGISPEEAQANNSSPPQSSIPESGPMLVRDLAAFVARLADGIERFPPRLREIQEFMEADRPLQSRSSDEYSRARSLIQNAMDAIRNLSHLTQYFSQLVIPLGDEPPRNLNIIQSPSTPRLSMSNFIIPNSNDSNATNFGLGPGLILAPAAAALAAAASGADGEPVVVSRSGVGGTGRNSGGGTQSNGNRTERGLLDLAFSTSIFTQGARPVNNGQDSNGVSNSTSSNSNGINASINVNANITPNITIRVEMPQSDQSRPVTNGQTQQFNGAPGLPSEVMEQITNSVNRLNDTGEALIIESDGPSHQDLGRVVGEAVAQTLQTLQQSTQENGSTQTPSSSSTSQTQRPPSSSTSNAPSSSSTSSRKRKRPLELEELFKEAELKLPIVDYLCGINWNTKMGNTDCHHFMRELCGELNSISVQEFINIFNGKKASEKICAFLQTTVKLDYLPRAAEFFIGRLFEGIQPKPDCDIIESNLSLLRHFLRDLTKHLSDPDKLSSFIVHFINLWIGLNCDILRGGQETLERCLGDMLVTHPIRHLSQFVTWSRSQAFSIDGYVMSEKISTLEEGTNGV